METSISQNLPNLDWANSLRKNLRESELFILHGKYGDKLMEQRFVRRQNARQAAKTKVKNGYFSSYAGKLKQSYAGKIGIQKTLEVERKNGYFESQKFKDQCKRWQQAGALAQIENRKKSGFYQTEIWKEISSSGGKIGGKSTSLVRKKDSKLFKEILFSILPDVFNWTEYNLTYEKIKKDFLAISGHKIKDHKFISDKIEYLESLKKLKKELEQKKYSIGKNHKHLNDPTFCLKIGHGIYKKISALGNFEILKDDLKKAGEIKKMIGNKISSRRKGMRLPEKAREKITQSLQKISLEQAKEIRELYKTGNYSQSELAQMFGFKNGFTISQIIRNKTYIDPNYSYQKNSDPLQKLNSLIEGAPSKFSIKELSNHMFEVGIKPSIKSSLKFARKISKDPRICLKLHSGKLGSNFDVDIFEFKK
jgi:hypothetical protein